LPDLRRDKTLAARGLNLTATPAKAQYEMLGTPLGSSIVMPHRARHRQCQVSRAPVQGCNHQRRQKQTRGKPSASCRLLRVYRRRMRGKLSSDARRCLRARGWKSPYQWT